VTATTAERVGKTARRRLADLVEDYDLYPRTKVDGVNVREIVSVIESGAGLEIPPIIVDPRNRIVDGYHRRRAWLKVLGETGEVDVVVREFASDAEAFAAAVNYNRSHGRKLSSTDLTRAALRLRDLGYSDEAITTVVRIPLPQVERVAVRVAVNQAGEPVPLKPSDQMLRGRILTDEQVKFLDSRTASSYEHLARQLIGGLDLGLVPADDPKLRATLRELTEALARWLA
jgi:hypothetical protein